MTDPVTVGIASAISSQATSRAIDQVHEYIAASDDERAAWENVAKECAIQAKGAYYQNVKDVEIPDRTHARNVIGSIGQVAQDLAIRGEVRGYDAEDIQLVHDLGQHCGNYANSTKMHSGENEQAFQGAIDDLSEDIFEMVST